MNDYYTIYSYYENIINVLTEKQRNLISNIDSFVFFINHKYDEHEGKKDIDTFIKSSKTFYHKIFKELIPYPQPITAYLMDNIGWFRTDNEKEMIQSNYLVVSLNKDYMISSEPSHIIKINIPENTRILPLELYYKTTNQKDKIFYETEKEQQYWMQINSSLLLLPPNTSLKLLRKHKIKIPIQYTKNTKIYLDNKPPLSKEIMEYTYTFH